MIEDHKHCVICGKAVEANKSICSPSCDEILKKQQKQVARSRTIMLVLFIAMIAIMMIVSILSRS